VLGNGGDKDQTIENIYLCTFAFSLTKKQREVHHASATQPSEQ
jgi:hypothetical protein